MADKTLQFSIVFRGNDAMIKKIADINSQITALRAEQKKLNDVMKQSGNELPVDKYNELQKQYAKNETALNQLSAAKREALYIQRKEAEAANSEEESYRKLAAETAVLEKLFKSMGGTLGGQLTPELQKIKEQIDKNYTALHDFDRGISSSRNLVGTYEESIIRAFDRLGLVDLLKERLTALNKEQAALIAELKELTSQYEAMKNTGGAALEEIGKKIQDVTDKITGVDKNIGEAKDGIKRMTETSEHGFEGMKEHMTEIAAVFLGGFGAEFALEKIKEFFEGAIEEALLAEDEISRLKLALENVGRGDALEGLIKNSERLAERFKFLGAGDIQQAQEKLVTFGKISINQINELIPVIIDYSVKTKKSLNDSATDFVKALQGEGKALKAIGVELKQGQSVAQNYAQIITEVGGRVKNSGEEFEKTAKGSLAELRQQYKNLQEDVGKELLPALVATLRVLLNLSGVIKDSFKPLGNLIEDIAELTRKLGFSTKEIDGTSAATSILTGVFNVITAPVKLLITLIDGVVNVAVKAVDIFNEVTDTLKQFGDIALDTYNKLAPKYFKIGADAGGAFGDGFNAEASDKVTGAGGVAKKIEDSLGGEGPLSRIYNIGRKAAEAYTKGFDINGKPLIDPNPKLNTLQGIQERITQLEQLRAQAVIGSKEFNTLTAELDKLKIKLDSLQFKKVEVVFAEIAKGLADASLALSSELIKSRIDALKESLQKELEAENNSYNDRLVSEQRFYEKLIADTKINIDKVKKATNLNAAQKKELIDDSNKVIADSQEQLNQVILAIQIGGDAEKAKEQLTANTTAANVAEAHGRAIATINKKWRDKDLQDLKDKLTTELSLIKAKNSTALAGIDTNFNEEQTKLNGTYTDGLTTYKKFLRDSQNLTDEFNRKKTQQNIEATKEQIKALESAFNTDKTGGDGIKSNKADSEILLQKAELYRQLAEFERQLTDITLSESERRKQKLLSDVSEVSNYLNQSVDAVGQLTSAIQAATAQDYDNRIKEQQKKIQNLQTQETKATGNLKNQLTARLKYETDYLDKLSAEQEEQKKEAAKADKILKAVQAGINTALAVTAFLAQGSYGEAIAAGILGAIQVAAILAAPLAKGGSLDGGNDLSVISGGNIPKDGGAITGNSHANGGVKFFDNKTGKYWEAEGGELYIKNGVDRYIINKRSAANPYLKAMASAINVAGGGRAFYASHGADLGRLALGGQISGGATNQLLNVTIQSDDLAKEVGQLRESLTNQKVIFVDKDYQQFIKTKQYIKTVATL